ncbi:MAG: MerC domain-containing protein [Fluviicola sp.]|jgi:hypothetical protein
MLKNRNINYSDIVGILSSSLCLVHCLATPILLAVGAAFFTHHFVAYFFLFISFISIYKTTLHSDNIKINLLLWLSFFGFTFSNILHDDFHWLLYLSYFFSVLIIIGHILNIKYCKECAKNNANEI